MYPEPRALRPYLLLTSTFVIVGCVAGYAVWHLASARNEAQLPAASGGTDAATASRVRAVDFLPQTPTKDRERITALVDALTGGPTPEIRTKDEAELLTFGAAAVPPLLTRLNQWSSVPGDTVDDRRRASFVVLDRLLALLRAKLTPASQAAPFELPPSRGSIDARAASWFAWWDTGAATRSG